MSLSCLRHSSTYQLQSIMTVPDPLSAGFTTMSTRFCNFLIATRSCLERLSRITAGCEDMRSFCKAVMNVPRAGSLPEGGFQNPLHLKGWLLASVAVFPSLSKNSFRGKRLAKSSMLAIFLTYHSFLFYISKLLDTTVIFLLFVSIFFEPP